LVSSLPLPPRLQHVVAAMSVAPMLWEIPMSPEVPPLPPLMLSEIPMSPGVPPLPPLPQKLLPLMSPAQRPELPSKSLVSQ
jgi:hypothetical protein